MAYFFNDPREYVIVFHFAFTDISEIEKKMCPSYNTPSLKLPFLL